MMNWSLLNKKDVKDLKDFKVVFIYTLLNSFIVIAMIIFSYFYNIDSFNSLNPISSTLGNIVFMVLGYYYISRLNNYIKHYKKIRVILSKVKVKKEV